MEALLPTVAKLMSALSGPAGRWLNKRRASKVSEVLRDLADPGTKIGKATGDSIYEILSTNESLESVDLSSVQSAVSSPLMTQFLEMCIVESILNANRGDKTRDAIRRGISTVLAVETRLEADARTVAAKAIEKEYFDAGRSLFRKLSLVNPDFAAIVQRSARTSRDQLHMSSPEVLMKRIEHVGRLEPVEWTKFEEQVRSYAAALVTDLGVLSIPTPTKEFQVSFDDAFQPTGLEAMEAQEGDSTQLATLGRAHEASDLGLVDALAQYRRVILFGDPGSGKSTNVQSAILDLARSASAGTLDAIPFRVTLRNLARGEAGAELPSIIDFLIGAIRSEYDSGLSPNTLRYLLHSGRAVVFLDGLDEILDVRVRREAVRRIGGLVGAFPASAYVITSRITGYDEAPVLNSALYRSLRTRPFTSAEVSDYAQWFFKTHGIGRYRRELGVAGFVRQTQAIADVRSNPLMLGVLCGLYASGRSVPADRAEIYRDCARMLFEQWDQLKETYTTVLDHDVAEGAIRALAHQVLLSGQEDISLAMLQEFLAGTYGSELGCDRLVAGRKARETLELWRGRQWILSFDGRREGEDWYRFSHRTFLEFFAAEHVAYTVTDGEALFGDLSEWIVARTAVPYVQLSVLLTSRRRAADGRLFLGAALAFMESERNDESSRLGCAILISEVLPGIRLPAAKLRVDAVTRLLRLVTSWLPRTPNIDRFFSAPYAYIDFRHLDQDESNIANRNTVDQSGPNSTDDDLGADAKVARSTAFIDDDDREDLVVDYSRVSHVLLGLDTGRPVEEGLLAGVLDQAVAQISVETPTAGLIRFALFLRATAEMEGSNLYSDWWRDHIRSTGDLLLSSISIDPSKIDADDSWVVIQLCSLGLIDPGVAIQSLEYSDLFVGGSPYPVTRPIVDGTPAHRLVEALLCRESQDSMIGMATAVLEMRNRMTGSDSLFVRGSLERCPQIRGSIAPECAIAASVLLCSLAQLGDERYAHEIIGYLDPDDPSHQLMVSLESVIADPLDFESWAASDSLAQSLGMAPKVFQKLIDGAK